MSLSLTPRFHRLVQSILVFLAAVAVTWTVAAAQRARDLAVVHAFYGADEVKPFADRFGGNGYSSRDYEEWLIRDFFQDRKGGTFLDVGANDYRAQNNTYYLETVLGWSGIAVDAQAQFADGYKRHRQRTTFVAVFASDIDDMTIPFYVPKRNSLTASSTESFSGQDGPVDMRRVPTLTLTTLLHKLHVERVDFLSLDVELAEPKALAGFDIDRFRPSLACVEGHPLVRQRVLDYFARHGYVLVGKYLRIDPKNLYFAPLGVAPA